MTRRCHRSRCLARLHTTKNRVHQPLDEWISHFQCFFSTVALVGHAPVLTSIRKTKHRTSLHGRPDEKKRPRDRLSSSTSDCCALFDETASLNRRALATALSIMLPKRAHRDFPSRATLTLTRRTSTFLTTLHNLIAGHW